MRKGVKVKGINYEVKKGEKEMEQEKDEDNNEEEEKVASCYLRSEGIQVYLKTSKHFCFRFSENFPEMSRIKVCNYEAAVNCLAPLLRIQKIGY
jgi:hypothetical protein